MAEVAEAEAIFLQGLPSVQFRLTEASGAAMAELTGRIVGEKLTVSICDRELVSAVVRERIEGVGVISLPDIETAMETAALLRGEGDCDGTGE